MSWPSTCRTSASRTEHAAQGGCVWRPRHTPRTLCPPSPQSNRPTLMTLPRSLFVLVLVGSVPACAGAPVGNAVSEDSAERTTATRNAHEAHPPHGAHADHVIPAGLASSDGPGFTAADVHFMQMMMGHHAQAVEMSGMVAERNAHPDLRQLAIRIDISQRDEMAFMTRWLEERGQPVPTKAQMAEMRMPGLVSEENMALLDAARGTEFDRLFLEFMIHHHLGAISMVDELFAAHRAGQDPDIFQFATDVANDQLDEISIMERILARLPSSLPE